MSGYRIHPQARTTPRMREEIRNSTLSERELARQLNTTRATIRRWKYDETVTDRSHRPQRLTSRLRPEQEAIVVALRRHLLLPLDDLLVVVREFIEPSISRSGLDRLLRREGVSRLRDLQPPEERDRQPHKTFKDYVPGFVHVDIKYLPQMPDESRRKYLFVAIDRASRWVYLERRADKSRRSALGFLRNLQGKAPFRIHTVLTDNDQAFTDRFTQRDRQPSGSHDFDELCRELAIEHRLTPPRRPQTNGLVERFNGRISDVLRTTRFSSAQDLNTTLRQYNRLYNTQIPQQVLGHRTPVQVLKAWQKDRPDLFYKAVYDLPGLDI
ncbi:IS481 family transposase [Halorhodospira halochloris]|uniref:IS481 family transposase n=1 Tax=Halorhodospira halochloris TaxID=1052 RepID=UPI001EE7F6DE|nr:IS481 family transposase [Halorhodospira halochloris]MCG5531726.1 IS481 family transposase [Halorhodospira halochloris]